jgi:starvation-inducible DNA-binding protein
MTYRAAVFDDDRTIGRKSTMHLDLPETACADTIALLRARLADALDLAARMKQAYWTVTDSSSCERRELFEACHDEIDECIDSLARRIAALSGVAECRIRAKALERSRHRYPLRSSRGEQLETAIRMVLARFSRAVRADIDQAAELGDATTVDVLGGVDTQLWVTEARLL